MLVASRRLTHKISKQCALPYNQGYSRLQKSLGLVEILRKEILHCCMRLRMGPSSPPYFNHLPSD